MILLSLTQLSKLLLITDLLKLKTSQNLVSSFPTLPYFFEVQLGLDIITSRERKSYLKWVIPFSSGKTAPLIGKCVYRQKSSLEQNVIYFSTNQPARSIHQYTSLYVEAFSTWYITLLRGLFGSEPFKFMPYRSLKCLGTYPLLLPEI